MNEEEKEAAVKHYLKSIRTETDKPISRLEVHKLRWLIARDKTKNISFLEYVALSDFIEDLWRQRKIIS